MRACSWAHDSIAYTLSAVILRSPCLSGTLVQTSQQLCSRVVHFNRYVFIIRYILSNCSLLYRLVVVSVSKNNLHTYEATCINFQITLVNKFKHFSFKRVHLLHFVVRNPLLKSSFLYHITFHRYTAESISSTGGHWKKEL